MACRIESLTDRDQGWRNERSDATHEQIEIAVGALYLSLVYAFRHIVKGEGEASANAFKEELVSALKGGGISMSLLDDAATSGWF